MRSSTERFTRNADYRFTETLKKLSQALLGQQGTKYIYSTDFGAANDRLFWRDPFSAEGQSDAEKILPAAAQMQLIAENAFTILVRTMHRRFRGRSFRRS